MQRFNSINALFRGFGGERTWRRDQSRWRRVPQLEGLEARVVLSALNVFGTGVNSTGAPLNTTFTVPMPSDPHYTLVTPPAPYDAAAAGVVGSAYVLNSNADPFGGPVGYVANGPKSEWISPDQFGFDHFFPAGGFPSGYYDYQTTFVVPNGFNPATAVLTGDWAVDNEGTILLNGKPITSYGGAINTTTPASFDSLHPFTINGNGSSGGSFGQGTNTLDFIVHNDLDSLGNPNPTGLRVDLSGTVQPDPPIPVHPVTPPPSPDVRLGPTVSHTGPFVLTGSGGQGSVGTSSATSLVKSSSSSSQNSSDSALSSVSDGNVVASSGIISLDNLVFDGRRLGKTKSIALTS